MMRRVEPCWYVIWMLTMPNLHNLQGDVTALVDMNGALVVEYAYDAWGKPVFTQGSMAGTLGYDNPFRYRGYVWDEETGLYYLRSRYYEPSWGRFVNADTILGRMPHLLDHNMFSYCHQNPLNRVIQMAIWIVLQLSNKHQRIWII